MDFEVKLKRLEEVVKTMETGDLELENSLKLFEEGIKLSRECHSQLTAAEQKVKILIGTDDKGKPITEDFKAE